MSEFDAEGLSLALARIQQLFRAGQMREAESGARAAIARFPASPAALNVLALVLKARGSLVEAESTIRRSLELAPRDAALHNNFGNILRARGDAAAAGQAYRRAIALNRDYAEAYYNLGIVLAGQGHKEQALAAYRRAVAIRPAYAEALTQIGVLLNENGDEADALASFDAALKVSPRDLRAQMGRAASLSALDRHDEAIDTLRAAVNARSTHEVFFALGNALVRANREAEALEAYGRAAALAPRFLAAHDAFAKLAWALDEPARAGESFARARAATGDDPDLLLAEAALRLRLGEPEAAGALASRAGARPEAMVLLAQSLIAQKRFGEAVPLLQNALGSEATRVVARRELGIALLQDGDAQRAVEVLEAGRGLAPFDQLILAYLTLAWREAGFGAYGYAVDFEKYVRVFDVPVEGLAPLLERLHTAKSAPLDQSLRGGTQTQGSLFAQKSPQIAALREAIRERVAAYIRDLPDDGEHPFLGRKSRDFAFSGSWSCLLRSSGYHTNHVHQEGWISSACYIALPEVVAHGGQGWLNFGQSNLGLGVRDMPEHSVPPAVGKLVLFPSYYWHGTAPFADAAARLSVAFDVVPR